MQSSVLHEQCRLSAEPLRTTRQRVAETGTIETPSSRERRWLGRQGATSRAKRFHLRLEGTYARPATIVKKISAAKGGSASRTIGHGCRSGTSSTGSIGIWCWRRPGGYYSWPKISILSFQVNQNPNPREIRSNSSTIGRTSRVCSYSGGWVEIRTAKILKRSATLCCNKSQSDNIARRRYSSVEASSRCKVSGYNKNRRAGVVSSDMMLKVSHLGLWRQQGWTDGWMDAGGPDDAFLYKPG